MIHIPVMAGHSKEVIVATDFMGDGDGNERLICQIGSDTLQGDANGSDPSVRYHGGNRLGGGEGAGDLWAMGWRSV
jgi:hypothetical protein